MLEIIGTVIALFAGTTTMYFFVQNSKHSEHYTKEKDFSPLVSLPKELIANVFKYCDRTTQIHMSLSCRKIFSIYNDSALITCHDKPWPKKCFFLEPPNDACYFLKPPNVVQQPSNRGATATSILANVRETIRASIIRPLMYSFSNRARIMHETHEFYTKPNWVVMSGNGRRMAVLRRMQFEIYDNTVGLVTIVPEPTGGVVDPVFSHDGTYFLYALTGYPPLISKDPPLIKILHLPRVIEHGYNDIGTEAGPPQYLSTYHALDDATMILSIAVIEDNDGIKSLAFVSKSRHHNGWQLQLCHFPLSRICEMNDCSCDSIHRNEISISHPNIVFSLNTSKGRVSASRRCPGIIAFYRISFSQGEINAELNADDEVYYSGGYLSPRYYLHDTRTNTTVERRIPYGGIVHLNFTCDGRELILLCLNKEGSAFQFWADCHIDDFLVEDVHLEERRALMVDSGFGLREILTYVVSNQLLLPWPSLSCSLEQSARSGATLFIHPGSGRLFQLSNQL